MYSQLCKKLSRKVPNFDPPNPDQTTTFRRLLLNKCQDEYTNRARASALFDQRTERLTPEEEEEKLLAKRKMLGNIKFIGELGKLEMLTHSILHRCCEELVKKTKEEDLECLCQIMSTCGHLLDNDKGKFLMDQYFARIHELSQYNTLPSRIRFMLQDMIELRKGGWVPRQIGIKESPKPIEEIRREAQEELGLGGLGVGAGDVADDFRFLNMAESNSRRHRTFASKKMTGMEDVFAPFPIGVTSLGTGPGVITPGEKPHGHDSNGFHSGPLGHYRISGGMRNFNHQNNMQGLMNGGGPFYAQHKNNKVGNNFANQHDNSQMRNNHNNMVNGFDKAAVAPRFRKQGLNSPPSQNGGGQNTSNDELSLRPPPNSMIKMFPQSVKPNPAFTPLFGDRSKPVLPKLSPPGNVISPKDALLASAAKNTIEKMKAKKDKGPSKEEVMKKIDSLIETYRSNKDVKQAAEELKNVKIPERFFGDALTSILNKAVVDRSESERELICNFIFHLVDDESVTQPQFMDAFRNILQLMGELEAEVPRIKTFVASFAARAICRNVLSLAEVAEHTENGNHYPFLLLVLQQLSKTIDKSVLVKMFEESKIQLLSTLPKIDRTKDRMADILEERELSFIYPLLKIQAEMTKQLQNNPSADAFGAWVEQNVDPTYHTSHGFISALVTVIFKFIAQETSQNQDPEQSDKLPAIRDGERELLLKFKPTFAKYLAEQVALQVIAIYALQGAWFAMDCPKVMLLRWFVNLYELEIIEEDAFLKWKEDIRDDYPGKGNALFQVNQWLLWLEQADDDDEGDEDEQDN